MKVTNWRMKLAAMAAGLMALLAAPSVASAQNAATNDYGGYDIAGIQRAKESDYESVRGWTVLSAKVAGKFAYCTGQFNAGGSVWRLGWDSMQWQIGLPMKAKPDWSGQINVDGNSQSISGSARKGWTFLWLGMQDLDNIRTGSLMRIEIGKKRSVELQLIGTAAVITKIEECVKRKGAVIAAAKQSSADQPTDDGPTDDAQSDGPSDADTPTDTADAGCPDDGGRLPFTGICAGRAINYLTSPGTYDETAFPNPDCQWVVNEVRVIEDALLYRALKCKGVTAELEYAGGAQWAQLMVKRSALNAAYDQPADVAEPQPLIWFNTIDPKNVKLELDMRARQGADAAELKGRKCAIKPADAATSPDGYVFDITKADPMYEQSKQEPLGPQCGKFSYGDGFVRFWRVLGDYAFLFDLTGDLYQDIDPNSLTLLRKDESGNWAAVQ